MGKVIYLSRHGQSKHNLEDKLGGNSDITKSGEEYAKNLFDYIQSQNIEKLNVYTSDLKRTKQTSKYFNRSRNFKFLNEINAGIFENKTYDYVKENYYDEYKLRKKDKFNYQYPMGESYKNLQDRIKKIFKYIDEDYNNEVTSLVICHNAVVRLIYGKLLNISNDRIPYIDIPLHTLFKFELIDNNYKLSVIDLS